MNLAWDSQEEWFGTTYRTKLGHRTATIRYLSGQVSTYEVMEDGCQIAAGLRDSLVGAYRSAKHALLS